MNKINSLSIFLIASFLIAVPSFASAGPIQTADCGFMCHAPMAYHGGGGPMSWYSLGSKSGSLQQMKARFRIREDQKEVWTAFEKVVLEQAMATKMLHGKTPRTSLEKAEFMKGVWERIAEQIKAVNGAFKNLYGALDQDQRHIANRSLQFCELPSKD
jgi:hypothetical protein